MATQETDGLRFKGKVVIVTGGCNGIGRGCVDVFVENGGKVAVFDIDEKTGQNMTTTGPGETYFIDCDITNEEQLKGAILSTVNKYGRIDCLVNNAGKHPGFRDMDNITTTDLRQLLELNLISHFVASREALPFLRKTKGSIVNISSMAGAYGQGRSVDYSATKGAIAGMTRSLAIDEAKKGVRVNAIAPAGVMTPLLKTFLDSHEEFRQEVNDYHLLKRCADVREIGLACLYLATDATFTTGTELHCSGGSEIGYGVRVH